MSKPMSSDDPGPSEPTSPALSAAAAADLTSAYAELQFLLVDRPDVTDFLTQVAVLAATVVPGSACGITMRRNHEVTTVAASDDVASQIDEIQYGRGLGPCLQAMHTGKVVEVPDLAAVDEWGDYRIRALAHGVRSSLSLPLTIDGVTRGALNLYAGVPDSFPQALATRAAAFARQAASALTMVLRNSDRTIMEEQMREALASRAVIDQAVGIVMGQQRINSARAFAVLREASQARNRKLRDVAADLIETVTGEPPAPATPFADPR